MKLRLEQLRLDGGTQARCGSRPDVVTTYADLMTEGVVFPPVVVFYDGTDYWIADGFHRVLSSKQAGFKDIECDVKMGTVRQATLYACGANAQHGLPRTNADKRRAVTTLFSDREWLTWSNREIAKACAVTEHLVRTMRDESNKNNSYVASAAATKSQTSPKPAETGREQRKGKDGKTFTMPKPKSEAPLPSEVVGPSHAAPSNAPFVLCDNDADENMLGQVEMPDGTWRLKEEVRAEQEAAAVDDEDTDVEKQVKALLGKLKALLAETDGWPTEEIRDFGRRAENEISKWLEPQYAAYRTAAKIKNLEIRKVKQGIRAAQRRAS